MIKEIFLKLKKYLVTILTIIIFIAICIPFVLAFLYLKQKGKTIQIHPEFKIIDIKTEDLIDLGTAIDEAKAILNGIK